jgi:hypothetical protein
MGKQIKYLIPLAKHLSYLKYFVVPEDNYIVFVNKPHYIDCLIKELGNPT